MISSANDRIARRNGFSPTYGFVAVLVCWLLVASGCDNDRATGGDTDEWTAPAADAVDGARDLMDDVADGTTSGDATDSGAWSDADTSNPDGDTEDSYGDAGCRNPNYDPTCHRDLGETKCENRGGSWGRHGLRREKYCLCPTPDGGCPCTDSSQCSETCIAKTSECSKVSTGRCAAYVQTFGCFCQINSDGANHRICVD